MAIPVFKYDEDLKQLYSEEGEVTVAVQGDDFGRCVQFEIPTVINDAESKATGNITSTSKVYLVWQNAHGDTGRKIAGASSDMLDSMAIQDGVCIVTFYLPDAFTAYAGKACLALEITDSDGEHGTRFAPVEVKVAQFVLDPFSKDLREDRIPDSLRAKAGAVTELYYDPVEKKLAASEELKKAFVKGDIMGRAINIILPRDLGGYGVVSKTDELTIIYKNANGQTGEYLVPSRNMAFYDRRSWAMNHRDDGIDVCLIQFGIPAPLATYSGEAEIEIEIKKPGGQITHLSPVKLQVGEFFDQSDIEPDDPKYSIVEQLKSEVAYLSAKIDQIVTGDNEISLDSYLTKTEAASTYETQTNAGLLLSKAGAASTYLTKADAADTYLAKEEAASKYVKNEAIGFNHFDMVNVYGPSTGRLDGAYSEYQISIHAEYESDVPITFQNAGGQAVVTKNIRTKQGMKYAAFFVAKNLTTNGVHILFGQGDDPITSPVQEGVSWVYTFSNNDDYISLVEVGPIPERITVNCAMRG